jgi:hypothetical protein
MTQSVITTSDYKLDKNGRKYPARRIRLGTKDQEQVQEASYRGNVGVMELVQFHSKANDKDKAHFNSLMKKKGAAKTEKEQKDIADQIWQHVQKVTGTRLHQMEQRELLSFKQIVESKEDFILQSLADRDINASIKDGKVVVHDHTQYAKAKNMVKRMGMPHEVVKGMKEDLDEPADDPASTVVQEAMPTHEFNKLVRGYLAHKKAAKKGNFKPMSIDQYKRTVVKALSVREDVKEDKTDTVTMDVPLLTRVLEMAREDIKSDEDLHVVVTKLIKMAKNGTLSMENYKKLTEDKKMVVPTLKPRDPNHLILAIKKNAAGKHRNKKRAAKHGEGRYKNKSTEE